MDGVHDAQRLKELQALPLNRKIMITQTRIMEWYLKFNGKVYVSFSGGKDSTVLLHIARQMFPDIPAVFSNTGLEYYEIQRFTFWYDNVTIIRPKMRFDEVVSTYGYPLISKEVAEAIYYARRINSQSVQVERERERAEPKSGASETNFLAKGAGAYGKQAEWKRLEIGGGESAPYPDGNSAEPQNSLARPMGKISAKAGRFAREPAESESISADHVWGIRRREELHENLQRDEQANRKNRGETDWANWRRECL